MASVSGAPPPLAAGGGEGERLGAGSGQPLRLIEPLDSEHKAAITSIAEGASGIKYGAPIGLATRDIAPGEWVHLHNCRSYLDERSSTLDVRTGATTDTVYE